MATWQRTAGQAMLHAFDRPTSEAGWWKTARCGAGPAVGETTEELPRCESCQAAEPEGEDDDG